MILHLILEPELAAFDQEHETRGRRYHLRERCSIKDRVLSHLFPARNKRAASKGLVVLFVLPFQPKNGARASVARNRLINRVIDQRELRRIERDGLLRLTSRRHCSRHEQTPKQQIAFAPALQDRAILQSKNAARLK